MASVGWSRSEAVKVLAVGIALGVIAAMVSVVVGLVSPTPQPRGAMSWRNPIPVDQELRTSVRESRWPMLWIGEICDGPAYQLRGGQQLRHATYAAACLSKVKPGGEPDNLMFARYATDELAQQDLSDLGYTFYVLRPWRGSLFLAATVSDDTVVDVQGHDVSASLQPLEVFGLPILRGPGAP